MLCTIMSRLDLIGKPTPKLQSGHALVKRFLGNIHNDGHNFGLSLNHKSTLEISCLLRFHPPESKDYASLTCREFSPPILPATLLDFSLPLKDKSTPVLGPSNMLDETMLSKHYP